MQKWFLGGKRELKHTFVSKRTSLNQVIVNEFATTKLLVSGRVTVCMDCQLLSRSSLRAPRAK